MKSGEPWDRTLSAEESVAAAEGRLHYDPHVLVRRLIRRGEEYADLDAAATLFEETKGSVLGTLVQTFIAQGRSATAAEHMAKADGAYRSHVEAMVEARRKALRAKVNYEAGKTFIDLTRTQEATRRAEMKLGDQVP